MLFLNTYLGPVNTSTSEMDNLTVVFPFVIIAVLVLVGISVSSNKKQHLPNNFRLLGNMAGMHKNHIIQVVGEPTAIVSIHGGELLHWVSSDYKIAIRFNAKGIFEGIQVRIH